MRPRLRPALDADFGFCESLSRSNMASYHLDRGIAWDPSRFIANWAQFENFVICWDDMPVGLLALLVVDGALEIRDLQIAQTHRRLGMGTWAVAQAKCKAAARELGQLRLRVYADNPAQHLYARLGFRVDSIESGVIHMSCGLAPNDSFKPSPLGGSA